MFWVCSAFNILTSKCASHHNGVQFLISHLPRWLRTAALASLLFDPPEPQNIGKNTVFRDFSTIFFLLTLSLLWSSFFFSSLLFSSLLFSSLLWLFPPLLFHLSILSEVWLLNFLRLRLQDLIVWKMLEDCKSSTIEPCHKGLRTILVCYNHWVTGFCLKGHLERGRMCDLIWSKQST